jgi:hypothetical protein
MNATMQAPMIFEHNRVILYHFDTYSAALLFARYGNSILAPSPLPENANTMSAPGDTDARYAPRVVLDAVVLQYGFDPAQLNINEDIDAWMTSDSGPIRIHFFRFSTHDAPKQAIEPNGVFKPISDMRGLPMSELNLLRQVFNLVIGGG